MQLSDRQWFLNVLFFTTRGSVRVEDATLSRKVGHYSKSSHVQARTKRNCIRWRKGCTWSTPNKSGVHWEESRLTLIHSSVEYVIPIRLNETKIIAIHCEMRLQLVVWQKRHLWWDFCEIFTSDMQLIEDSSIQRANSKHHLDLVWCFLRWSSQGNNNKLGEEKQQPVTHPMKTFSRRSLEEV